MRLIKLRDEEQDSVRGFTLIELLVVIAIIGMLSSVVLASMNTARKKARDARRIADLGQIRTALEMYYSDHNYYPQSGCGWDCNGYRYSYGSTGWNALAADLAPYLAKLPVDPINDSCAPWSNNCHSYAYGNVWRNDHSHGYDLTTNLESTSHPQRCAVQKWRFYYTNELWCGTYSGQIYEASID